MLPPVIVIATHNRKKAQEMTQILSRALPSVAFRTLAEYPGAPEPDETGADYAANAAIKAESACAFTGEWSLADDAGLEIDALDGAPGLYSKRFGGDGMPFPEKIARILDLLRDVPEADRTARFRCSVALARPGLSTQGFNAICAGRIALRPSGYGGFGYDPIFFLPELGVCMADLTPEQKHRVSHRGKVLAMVVERLTRDDV